MSTTTKEKQLLTVREVAELLTVSQRTVWKWVSERAFPAPIRKGTRFVRWRRADVEAWLAAK